MRFTVILLVQFGLILFPSSSLIGAPLTFEEISQIETDLGIILSPLEIELIGDIAKPDGPLPQWRVDAEARIAQHRMADLKIKVLDTNGRPIPGAEVQVTLQKNAFKFGGVVRAQDLTDSEGNLAAYGSTPETWTRLVTSLCNALGAGNNFKPKLTRGHQYLPGFLAWAKSEELDVRGHLLMWPGGGDVSDLDDPAAVPGVDYGNHLSRGNQDPLNEIPGYEDVISYDVLGAVNTYRDSDRLQADKDALEAVVDAEIAQWAGLWDVYEWDVINETVGNTLLQEILGYDQMAEWFKIAEANVVNPACKLLINEFKIISAAENPAAPSWQRYTTRRDTYMSRIDRIISEGGRIDQIGFQNRYNNVGVASPETTYARLEEWAGKYGLGMVGTEFEVVDNDVYDYDEEERARITEQTLTLYYSHPLTKGLFAWTFMDQVDEKALTYYDGTVKLNGLVWYFLHRIRYATDKTVTTNAAGEAAVHGFKGDYDVTVSYGGKDYPANFSLTDDDSLEIPLEDVTAPVSYIDWPLDDPETLRVQGARYVNIDSNGMNFHRFSKGILDGSEAINLNPVKAGTTSGVNLSFQTRSRTVKLHFAFLPGDENRNSLFSVYQDGTYKEDVYFPKTETTIVLELISEGAPGDLVRHDIVLPHWSNPILTRVEIESDMILEEAPPPPDNQIVFLGDSISHGTGQGSTRETYPFIAAENLNAELFNLAVGGAKIAPEIAALLADFDPVEVIWILAGYNDWQGSSESVDAIANDYEQLLATIREHQPEAEVFCCTLTYTTRTSDAESGVTATGVREAISGVVNARIVAGDDKLHLVQGDHYSDATYLNDAVHFNTEGAEQFANHVFGIVNPYLNPPELSYLQWVDSLDWQGETQRARMDDPDKDGASNFMEFCFDRSPIIPERNCVLKITSIAGSFFAGFLMKRNAGDVTQVIRFSNDLKSWVDIAPVTVMGLANDPILVDLSGYGAPLFIKLTVNSGQR
jgi:GH35 family endo-1,4-beta-xylanase/lysophospholipase L1-like esterase